MENKQIKNMWRSGKCNLHQKCNKQVIQRRRYFAYEYYIQNEVTIWQHTPYTAQQTAITLPFRDFGSGINRYKLMKSMPKRIGFML